MRRVVEQKDKKRLNLFRFDQTAGFDVIVSS